MEACPCLRNLKQLLLGNVPSTGQFPERPALLLGLKEAFPPPPPPPLVSCQAGRGLQAGDWHRGGTLFLTVRQVSLLSDFF